MASLARYGTLDDERVSSKVMDEKRQENIAYEYLCHLEETRVWIQACIKEKLPPATELEEELRNGVYLAKLANFAAPAVVQPAKIYDCDQNIYKTKGLQFRHTENINLWFSAMKAVGMPSSCQPETFDIYDKRNMPKAIYCLHTFSLFLFKKGLAPKIENLFGKLKFTDEEIYTMQKELDKCAIQMPCFKKISGILPPELPLDVAALHASIIVINKALEKKNSKFLESLQNPRSHLSSVVKDYEDRYKQGMTYAKKAKIQNNRRADKPKNVSNIYDELLTQEEIQQCINEVNEIEALDTLDITLTKGDLHTIMKILKSPHLGLLDVEPTNKENYYQQLLAERDATVENNNPVLLSKAEVQRIIYHGNEMARDQIKEQALSAITQAVSSGNITEFLKSLMNEDASILCVDQRQAVLYLEVLEAAKLHHSILSLDVIQREVNAANKLAHEANKTAMAVIAINIAIQDGNPKMVLEILEKENVYIDSVNPELIDEYFAEFVMLRNGKDSVNFEESCDKWLYLLFGGHDYYFNCSTFEYAWEKPRVEANFVSFLQHHEIQEAVSRVNVSHKQKKLRDYIEPVVVNFQAHVRRYLFRKEKERRFNYFVKHKEEIIKIQRWWRWHIMNKQQEQLQSSAATTIQAYVRKWLVERRHQNRIAIFKKHEDKVRNFQHYWRAKRHLRNLMIANPKLAEVWKHVQVLINSTRDNVEEIEFHKVRADVVQRIRKNKDLEHKVNDMDVKIGLIVRNKITSTEFAREGRRGSVVRKDSLEGTAMRGGLRALNKDTRTLLESYQHLFYALQTHPYYLARLIFAISPGHSFKFVESVIYTLFNYGSTPREEYLLFLLFRHALEEEFRCKINTITDVTCGNTLLFKMVINYNRSGCRQSNLRKLLEGPVGYLLEKEDFYLGVDPVEIYQRWINKQETQTGVMSSLPCDVLPEDALKFPEVVNEIDKNLNHLKQEALIFVDAICDSADKIPYGVRYIAKHLCENLKTKFPAISEEETLKVIGNFLYYRYINPAIAAPDVYEIVILEPSETISTEQRKNLASVAKVLHVAAAFKLFASTDKMAVINNFISECHKKFRKFFIEVCAIEEPDMHFDINMYTEETLMTPPTVVLTLQEIFTIHELLCVHEDCVAPDPADKLHGLLRDLGKPETLHSLFGQEDSSLNFSNSEVCLSLTNKFSVDCSPTSDSLFVETKRMVVHLLQCQQPRVTFSDSALPTASLWDTVKSAPTEEERKSYMEHHSYSTFFQKDIIIPLLKRLNSIDEFKESLSNNLHNLELSQHVKKENHYQEIVDKLHEDLFHNTEYRQKRRADIWKLKEALVQLEKKTEFYQTKLCYYEDYMKNCLGATNTVRRLTRRRTLGSIHEKHVARKRYTAYKLMEKGIIQEINMNPIEMKAVIFEIARSSDAGVFSITVKVAGSEQYSVDLHIQDLLQKQYEGQAVVEMFGIAKVNINLFLYLLNTKF